MFCQNKTKQYFYLSKLEDDRARARAEERERLQQDRKAQRPTIDSHSKLNQK